MLLLFHGVEKMFCNDLNALILNIFPIIYISTLQFTFFKIIRLYSELICLDFNNKRQLSFIGYKFSFNFIVLEIGYRN